ncbi:MAG: ParB/RepB/Spo0J family partition protein [Actinomycetes bacterium]
MTEKRRGLGKGLGALIPTQPRVDEGPSVSVDLTRPARTLPPRGVDAVLDAADTVNDAHVARVADADSAALTAHYAELPLASIVPNPRQPRQVFDEEALAELVHSLREIGLLQPIVVRPVGAGRYELVAGERRWRAAEQAGFELIPAIVRETADDVLLRDALLENLHRAQLNPLEEAAAYDQLLKDFGCTQDELATRIGRSRPQVSNTLRLLRLPTPVQRRVAAGVLSAGHARALLALPDSAAMERMASRVVAEGLSVRTVEELVALGDDESDKSSEIGRRRTAKVQTPALADLAEALSDALETRVQVSLGRRKGTLSIDFATVDDLERIVELIAPAAAEQLRGAGSAPAATSPR